MRKALTKKPPEVHLSSQCRSTSESRSFSLRPRKSNITAERLTLLPGFLSKSSSKFPKTIPSGHEETVNEDYSVRPPKLRRSWRLSKKNQPESVAGYFNTLVSDSNRSLFREIKAKYAEKVDENTDSSDADFGALLLSQVKNYKRPDPQRYRKKILEEIEKINGVLTGQTARNMSMNRKRGYNEEEKENYPMKFTLVPPSRWVFQTPPNRKLNFSQMNVEENGLKPVVIEKNKDKNVVYEMNNKINVDLTGFKNRQEIDIDKRYMVEVEDRDEEQPDDKCTFPQSDPFELENYFLGLTCRPKKVSSVPRFTALKRKRDIFDNQPECSSSSEELKSNITFKNLNINDPEESFTFKFTNSDCLNGATTGHLFDFDGNKKESFNFRF